jgi:glycogen debranching enzyme
LFTAMFEAGLHFDLQRMPELFCGFPRRAGDPPVPYPVACSPQAWAAGSVFALIQACLGLSIDAPRAQIRFDRPQLPPPVDELRIHNLQVAGAAVDVALVRQHDDVAVSVTRREGDVKIVVVM